MTNTNFKVIHHTSDCIIADFDGIINPVPRHTQFSVTKTFKLIKDKWTTCGSSCGHWYTFTCLRDLSKIKFGEIEISLVGEEDPISAFNVLYRAMCQGVRDGNERGIPLVSFEINKNPLFKWIRQE